jgi:putative Mn2+ efflux pump MntP
MSLIEQFLIALGLSMDAFAAAVCIGLTLREFSPRNAATVGLYFGGFQAGMPVLGYLTATLFAEGMRAYDHWVAFGLLAFLGGRMVIGSFAGSSEKEDISREEAALGCRRLLPLAVATSIDAAAVGVSFAFIPPANLPFAFALIGAVTFVMSAVGVKIGCAAGVRFKAKAELAGGIILILIGCKILLEHLEVL